MLSPCEVTLTLTFDPMRFFFPLGLPQSPGIPTLSPNFGRSHGGDTQEVAAIPPEMTRRVMEKYRGRLNQCIDNEVSDVAFKF
jgi:hypothetical protein